MYQLFLTKQKVVMVELMTSSIPFQAYKLHSAPRTVTDAPAGTLTYDFGEMASV